ncbi:MAG: hypothetical protein WD969_14200 [Paracoccaceae bacterium]
MTEPAAPGDGGGALREPAAPDEALSVGDEAALKAAKTRDAALVLPLAGLALFTPPLIEVFAADETIFGAPLIVVYVFTAWAGLVAAAFLLSRRLARVAAARGEAE